MKTSLDPRHKAAINPGIISVSIPYPKASPTAKSIIDHNAKLDALIKKPLPIPVRQD